MKLYCEPRGFSVVRLTGVYAEADHQGLNRLGQRLGADAGPRCGPLPVDVVNSLGDFDHEGTGFPCFDVSSFGDDVRREQLASFDWSYPADAQGFVDGGGGRLIYQALATEDFYLLQVDIEVNAALAKGHGRGALDGFAVEGASVALRVVEAGYIFSTSSLRALVLAAAWALVSV